MTIQCKAAGSRKWNKKTTRKQTLTIRNLKKGKKYQVRIHAFKKSGKKTYFSAWSKVKLPEK